MACRYRILECKQSRSPPLLSSLVTVYFSDCLGRNAALKYPVEIRLAINTTIIPQFLDVVKHKMHIGVKHYFV